MGISDRAARVCNFLIRVMAYQLKQDHNCLINLSTVLHLEPSATFYREIENCTAPHQIIIWVFDCQQATISH